MSGQDIVITGLGLVLPCGDGIEAARASLEARRHAFTELPPALGSGLGGACAAFTAAGIIPPMTLRRLDRCTRFGWVAAQQAFADAAFDPTIRPEEIGVALGTLTAGTEASEAFMRPYLQQGPAGASPLVFPNCVANAPGGHLSIAMGLRGPSVTQIERECGALSALEQAARWLRMGLTRAVLVMGMDALYPLLSTVLDRMGLRCRHGLPEAGSGGGFLPGEGAQAFLLERRDDAESRGARIRAVLGALEREAGVSDGVQDRASALAACVDRILDSAPDRAPDRWIGGSNGFPRLDRVEAGLRPRLPAPLFPKTLWGELGGAGGQLLAAALLEPAGRVLTTSPASFGPCYAIALDRVTV